MRRSRPSNARETSFTEPTGGAIARRALRRARRSAASIRHDTRSPPGAGSRGCSPGRGSARAGGGLPACRDVEPGHQRDGTSSSVATLLAGRRLPLSVTGSPVDAGNRGVSSRALPRPEACRARTNLGDSDSLAGVFSGDQSGIGQGGDRRRGGTGAKSHVEGHTDRVCRDLLRLQLRRRRTASPTIRGYDNRHDTFSITNAALGAEWNRRRRRESRPANWIALPAPSTSRSRRCREPRSSTRRALTSGSSSKKPMSGTGCPVGARPALQAGVFLSPVGPEVAVKDNWNWSRSNLFFGLCGTTRLALARSMS